MKICVGNAITRYTYDAVGQLTTTGTYDHRGNVLSESRTIAGTTLTASYTWNTTDLLTRITYPSSRVATFTFDTLGRNTRITTNLPGVAAQNVASAVTYAPFGGITGWLGGNALTHTRLLDQDYRLTDLTVSGTTATVHDVNYGYNTVDQLISHTDTVRPTHTQVFGYDVLDQLETASGVYGNQTYTLDANGNRLQRTGSAAQTLTYTPVTNRLDTRNGLTLSHDAVGNRLTDSGNRSFTYNHANRRATVSVSGGLQGTYSYNALGQRTRKVVPVSGGNRTTHFMFGLGGELLGELAVNPDGSRTFTDWYWLNSLPVARHVRVLNTAGTQVSDTRTYLHPDHLGTPRLVTNASRQVIWRLDTDPFGDGTVSEDPDGNSVLEVMPLRFPGQYFDVEAGVAYNYFRDYDQGTGRYTQSDPIGLGGGVNRFGYVFQNPTIYTDPTGEAVPAVVAACASNVACVAAAAGAAAVVVDSVRNISDLLEQDGRDTVDASSVLDDRAAKSGETCPDDEVDENCEALYRSTLSTCESLKGRKRFQCFEVARINREQCYQERRGGR